MRLTTTTNVSVDGVMQGLGGPDEDRSGGFERGGWAIPLLDTETGDYLNQVYGGAAAFLFGRRTYEIFAGSWGAMADPSTSPIAAALNSRPKYVASTSLADPQWAGTTVLHGDVATAVGDLKAQLEHAQDPSTPHRRPSCSALDLVVCRSTSTPNLVPRFCDSAHGEGSGPVAGAYAIALDAAGHPPGPFAR